jgi:hypothetical protein
MVKRMLLDGFDAGTISRVSGMAVEEINSLKQQAH